MNQDPTKGGAPELSPEALRARRIFDQLQAELAADEASPIDQLLERMVTDDEING